MFWVLTPIIRSSYNCNYSFWHWSTGSTAIRSRCYVGNVELPTEIQGAYKLLEDFAKNHIFTNTEQKYMMLLPFERGMFAV